MDEFQFRVLQDGINGINARLDRQNGRLGEAEQAIAVLEDRSEREKGTASKWGGITGSLGGLIGGFLAGLLGNK